MNALSIALFCLAPSAFFASADEPQLETSARAAAAWSHWDADRSGRISLAEAQAGGIDVPLFERGDENADGSWSRCEFIVQYAERSQRAGIGIAADLEAEIARIQALRKARHLAGARIVCDGSGPAAVRLAHARVTPLSAALADLQARAARGTMTRESVTHARALLAAQADARAGQASQTQKSRELAAWTEVQRELDRVENGVRAPREARASVEGLRSALVRNGWIESVRPPSRMPR